MDDIFSLMDTTKKSRFSKEYVEEIYTKYLSKSEIELSKYNDFKLEIKEREILLIAPGLTSYSEKDKINDFIIKKNPIIILVNFNYELNKVTYIFLSNNKRYCALNHAMLNKTIVTSNIETNQCYLKVHYKDLINGSDFVKDNAGLMAIKLLIDCGVKEVNLAGFDGYSDCSDNNYVSKEMILTREGKMYNEMNKGINDVLKKFTNYININFITSIKYLHI